MNLGRPKPLVSVLRHAVAVCPHLLRGRDSGKRLFVKEARALNLPDYKVFEDHLARLYTEAAFASQAGVARRFTADAPPLSWAGLFLGMCNLVVSVSHADTQPLCPFARSLLLCSSVLYFLHSAGLLWACLPSSLQVIALVASTA